MQNNNDDKLLLLGQAQYFNDNIMIDDNTPPEEIIYQFPLSASKTNNPFFLSDRNVFYPQISDNTYYSNDANNFKTHIPFSDNIPTVQDLRLNNENLRLQAKINNRFLPVNNNQSFSDKIDYINKSKNYNANLNFNNKTSLNQDDIVMKSNKNRNKNLESVADLLYPTMETKSQISSKHKTLFDFNTASYDNYPPQSENNYIIVDEYQDCSDNQREALSCLFDSTNCYVMRIGDPDQAIYSFQEDNMVDWVPSEGYLSIESSCRYPQEIADILIPLRKGGPSIISTNGSCGYKPVLIVFNNQSIDKVLSQFVVQLEDKGLHDSNGEYYAIGFVGKESVTGLRIGSYWNKYETSSNTKKDYRYWIIIEEICESLRDGKLYHAENRVRKLICRLFHYTGVTNKDTGKEFTQTSIKDRLKQEYYDIYTNQIIALSELQDISKDTVDGIVRSMMDALLNGKGQSFFDALPAWFLDRSASSKNPTPNNNIFIDPIRGRKIRLCTVHAVKGQTHDATLFLETEKNRGSDLARILWCYGIGKPGQSSLYEYSRKLAYVGFSRPKKLLCVAIQESTYEKCKKQFQNKLWEVVDVRQ